MKDEYWKKIWTDLGGFEFLVELLKPMELPKRKKHKGKTHEWKRYE